MIWSPISTRSAPIECECTAATHIPCRINNRHVFILSSGCQPSSLRLCELSVRSIVTFVVSSVSTYASKCEGAAALHMSRQSNSHRAFIPSHDCQLSPLGLCAIHARSIAASTATSTTTQTPTRDSLFDVSSHVFVTPPSVLSCSS